MIDQVRGFERNYLRPGRLNDVLALLQVLALDRHAHRQEGSAVTGKGLRGELQGSPVSAETWTQVAAEHPEFFRVRDQGTHRVSLVSRHVLPKVDGERVLPPELIGRLLQTAVDIHDRQVRLADRWTYLVPIWVALVAAVTTLGAALIQVFGP